MSIARFFIGVLLLGFSSCGEQLIAPPEPLIPKDTMVAILKDMAIMTAAKNTNSQILKDNGIEPTRFVLNKYKVDSVTFVVSDRYYASLPATYTAIYEEVQQSLALQKENRDIRKREKDSLESINKVKLKNLEK